MARDQEAATAGRDQSGGLRRTAVTGVGVVAPGGTTREAFWEMITAGRTATRRITAFDPEGFRSQIAAEADFDPIAAGLTEHERQRQDRYIQFATAAALEAVEDSGLVLELTEADREASVSGTFMLEPVNPDRIAVSLGSAVGGTIVLENGFVAVSNRGQEWLVDPDYAPPFLYEGLVPSSLASEIAYRFGATGPSVVVSTGCTSGLDSIGYGHQMIQDQEADIVIAGASESPISPISMACFDPIGATSRRNDDAAHASRPFDRDRDGFVMGEGCAILILEELESALARGAHIYCEVAGYANRGNAYHMTGLKPDALEMTEAIKDAMRQAGVRPEEIEYINAHGSGTKQNDIHETSAFKNSLGEHAYKVPISSIKSMIGHSLGGIGSIEMAACALVIDRGVVPPTANWENRDPLCDLDYTPNVARPAPVTGALSTGSGFGGFQSAMIFSLPPELREVSV
jgi:minimal PKS ketosynthase (KS/KS alpha)